MATKNDFQQRQRERERQQRIRVQRNKRILSGLGIAAVLLIIILIAVSCSSKKKSGNSQGYVPENANSASSITETTAPTSNPVTDDAKTLAGIEDIPSASEQNDLLKIVENSTASYYAYLTFDDGPTTKITPQILDTLRRYNIKATFFEVGAYIRKNPDLTRRVHEEGHLIASHSDSHDYDKLYKDEQAFTSEIENAYQSICDTLGEEPFRLFRFPGGSYNAGDHAAEKQIYKKTLAGMNYYYVDWNTLNGDAEGRTKDADGLFEYFKQYMPKNEGENVVVLMHDASTKQATADALPKIIEYLLDKGYSFHRLDDIPYDSSKVSSDSSSSDTNSSSSSKSSD